MSCWSITIGAVAGFAGWYIWPPARTSAESKNNPDPYPLDVLRREPDGEEVMIERPDGTRIRAIVAGYGPTICSPMATARQCRNGTLSGACCNRSIA